jgi:hypothetical protein
LQVNEKVSGRGIDVMRTGDRYEGAFVSGIRHGSGVFTWANAVFACCGLIDLQV